jgi:hypothetical protein
MVVILRKGNMTKQHTALLQSRLAEIAACLSASQAMLKSLQGVSHWEFLTEELEVNLEELIADYDARIARDEHVQDTLGQVLVGQGL